MADRRPNVLWLMTDEQRTDSLGCYGSPWAATPHLDGLAREGAVFRQALTPAPVCVPARLSLLTGRYPARTGIWWNRHRHGLDLPHLTAPFREAGFVSASFGKQDYHTRQPAFAAEERFVLSDAVHYYHYAERYDAAAHGVVQYPPKPYPWIFGGRYPEPADRTAEAAAVRAAEGWLEALPAGRPFILRVSTNGPHTPVVPPAPFDTAIAEEAIALPAAGETLPPGRPAWVGDWLARAAAASRLAADEIRAMRRYYYGEVAYLDALFGGLLEWMRERGLLENTIVALCSDHGTHLGDYGLVQKQSFYAPVLQVPLLLWYPERIPGGRAYDTPVESLSLLPTLLDLAGLEIPPCDGVSLAPALVAGEEPAARPVFSEFTLGSFEMRPDDRLVLVREGDWRLSCCLDPEPHDLDLCNLAEDPLERTNLHGAPGTGEIEARLLALIDEHLRAALEPLPPRTTIPEETR